jgi:ABC-type multidrug transport system ATPase subunit
MPPDINTGPVFDLADLAVDLGAQRLTLDRPCAMRAGHLYLVVGRSGSGKSSFARALMGFGDLADPAVRCRGNVAITDAAGNACVIWKESTYNPAAREAIAFLPQTDRLGFLDALSVRDNLALFSKLNPASAVSEIDRLAKQFQVHPLPRRLPSASSGERIRLSAIRGLLPRKATGDVPSLVIADEPTAGLDPTSAKAIVRSLLDLARNGPTIVVVITHDPKLFFTDECGPSAIIEQGVAILERPLEPKTLAERSNSMIATLRLEPAPQARSAWQNVLRRFADLISRLGDLALSPLAFLWGLLALHRPLVLVRQVLVDAGGLGTQAFSLAGCLLIAGTVAYFIFERMPRPELVEPLLLPEFMALTGHTLVRVVLPLGACGLVTTKLGAAQAARLAAAVRTGLLETLAMANWRVEAYALVPAVLSQFLSMALATMLALGGGLLLAAVVYIAGHEGQSLPLTVNLMRDGLDQAPHWVRFLLAKVTLSSFLGGSIAALYGIAPSRADDDVARAVHHTLLWSVLAIITCQCALIVWEFAPR